MRAAMVALGPLVFGCTASETPHRADAGADRDPGAGVVSEIPALGAPDTFDVATWNLDWFGDPGNGPSDERRQQRGVAAVVRASDLDLWALQEVVDARAFEELLRAAPGYAGLLADDPSVSGGPTWYRDFGDREQKVAVVYRPEVVTVRAARVILAEENHAFAGRPPLEVEVTISGGGASVEGVVVVLHAKASPEAESRDRRAKAARALARHLDTHWPTLPVWVLGDFNDDVDASITAGRASPYAEFVDASHWHFATAALSRRGLSSTVGFGEVVDHHLVSDEAWGGYVSGSAEVFRVDRWNDDYGNSVSDHYPVVSRYALPPGGGAQAAATRSPAARSRR